MNGDCPCTGQGTVVHPASGLAECRSGTTGPDLLCMPPGPGIGHQIARGLHEILADLGRVRLIDYPGHGASAPVAHSTSLVEQVGAGVTPDTVLIGHSWGAGIAAQVAAAVQCAALVLLCPPSEPPAGRARWSKAARRAVASSRGGSAGSAYARYLTRYAIPLGLGEDTDRAHQLLDGVPVFEQAWRELRGDLGGPPPVEAAALAAACGTPVLAVLPEDDHLADRAGVRELIERGMATGTDVPGGHYCFLDAPADLRSAIQDFLSVVVAANVPEPTGGCPSCEWR